MPLSASQWVTFDFDGTFQTQVGTHYFIVLFLSGFLSAGALQVYRTTAASNGGREVTYQSSSWFVTSTPGYGLLFEVLGMFDFGVFYDANRPSGASGTGSVPVDNNRYLSGATVTVQSNSGNLTTAGGYTFLGWDTNSNATIPTHAVSGNNVSPSTFIMGYTDVTLYAIWGSSGGGGFDGGVINNPLDIKCKFPYLADQPAINSWMTSAPLNPSNYNAYLRFTNINNPQHSTDIYGITFKDDTNTNVPAIGINDSLLVRKNLFAQGYIRTAKSILRLEKSTPYTPPNAGASGNVNLGTASWPFDEIFTSYGHIGNLTIPQALYVDYIEGYTANNPNAPLTIKPKIGQMIKLDGDVQITGSLTGGGGGGVSWNGGEVSQPISISNDFLRLYFFQTDADYQPDQRLSWSIHDWIFWYNTYNSDFPAKHRRLPPGAVEDDNIGLRLKEDFQGGWWTNIVGGRIIQDHARNPAGTPATLIRDHIIAGRDMDVRGKIKSYEGIIVLLGNCGGAEPPSDPEE